MAILGIKTWKMENIAENDRKERIRTRQGFGELKRAKSRQNMAILGIKTWKMENIAENV